MRTWAQLLEGLNPQQKQAVTQVHGPVLIVAGAGSGKTRVLTRRIAYILATGAGKPENILAVTFTNKAAAEMRERVAELTGKKAAQDAAIGTFHAFCLGVLREHAERLGLRRDFSVSSEADARTRMRRILADLDGVRETFDPQRFLEGVGQVKNQQQTPDDYANQPAEDATAEKYQQWFPAIYEQYESALRAANAVDFDDLLVLTLKLWRDHPDVLERMRERYRFIMVDEFQDTNQLQYALLRALAGPEENICVVGDDDQSIYSWRGADPRNILEFERGFRSAHVVKLEQNYRSTPTILDAANAVIQYNTARREKKLWSALESGRPIDWLLTANEGHEAEMALSWFKLIRDKTGAKPSDFAILYRSNTQSRPFEIILRQAGVPYAVNGGQELFDRSEVRDIVAYLKAAANPYDESAVLRVVNMPRRGVGDAALHRVHDICRTEGLPFIQGLEQARARQAVGAEAQRGIQAFQQLLREYGRRFQEKGASLPETVENLVHTVGYREELRRASKTDPQFQMRWGNVEAVIRAIAVYEDHAERPSLVDFLDKTTLGADVSWQQMKAERRRDGVSLMTIHSAKGLEFPFVFIAGMEEGLLPHEKSIRAGAIEEERRLFYVALTRAMRHATVFESISRSRHGRERLTQTSRFLKEIPEGLVRKRELAARDMVEERTAPDKDRKKRAKPKARRRSA